MALGPKLVVASLGAVNLVAGLALGIAVDRTFLLPTPPQGPPARPHRGGRAAHGRGENGPPSADRETARLTEKLSLDPDQAEKVKTILTARREAFGEVMKDVAPRMKALREETENQIRAVLRPEQASKLEELRREWETRGPRPDGAAPVTSQTPIAGKEGLK